MAIIPDPPKSPELPYGLPSKSPETMLDGLLEAFMDSATSPAVAPSAPPPVNAAPLRTGLDLLGDMIEGTLAELAGLPTRG